MKLVVFGVGVPKCLKKVLSKRAASQKKDFGQLVEFGFLKLHNHTVDMIGWGLVVSTTLIN